MIFSIKLFIALILGIVFGLIFKDWLAFACPFILLGLEELLIDIIAEGIKKSKK